jgi:hypothetical protein
MTGTSDFGPLLKQVTPLLAANTPPYRAVFMAGTSCGGVSAVFDPTLTLIKDVPGTATKAANYAYYFDDTGTQVSCSLDPAGNVVDIGVSNLYSTVCNATYVPGATVAGYQGPVVTFGFTVPAVSTQNSISVEAAHIIFGLGGQNPSGIAASPWIDPAYYSIRNSGAGSTALAAELIHVPRTAFWGVDRLSTDNIRDSLNAVRSTRGIHRHSVHRLRRQGARQPARSLFARRRSDFRVPARFHRHLPQQGQCARWTLSPLGLRSLLHREYQWCAFCRSREPS